MASLTLTTCSDHIISYTTVEPKASFFIQQAGSITLLGRYMHVQFAFGQIWTKTNHKPAIIELPISIQLSYVLPPPKKVAREWLDHEFTRNTCNKCESNSLLGTLSPKPNPCSFPACAVVHWLVDFYFSIFSSPYSL